LLRTVFEGRQLPRISSFSHRLFLVRRIGLAKLSVQSTFRYSPFSVPLGESAGQSVTLGGFPHVDFVACTC